MIFGLSTSPKLWWLKFLNDILGLSIYHHGVVYKFEQNEVDPCALLTRQGKDRSSWLFTDQASISHEPRVGVSFSGDKEEKKAGCFLRLPV